MDTPQNPWIPPLSKLCVALTLLLILMGAVVTTAGAGMISPNAPHVDGALIPWAEMFKSFAHFAEHGHRLVAMSVGFCIGLLCACLWRNWPAFIVAIAFMGAGAIGTTLGWDKATVAHLRVWPAMIVFIVWLIVTSRKRGEKPGAEQWLALIAFICACVQAVVGVLRVETETAGNVALATNIRTIHGVFAQIFLAVLVVLAARLSPVWQQLGARGPVATAGKIRRMAFVAIILYLLQLACAAYLRHRPGQWQAIAAWPATEGVGWSLAGSWLPAGWSHVVGVHFLHTRILPVLLLGHLTGMCIGIFKRAGEPRLSRPAVGLIVCIALQFVLGVLMFVFHAKAANGHPHAHITNTHVLIGAFLVALLALVFARAGRLRGEAA